MSELPLGALNPFAEHALVELELGFTGAAQTNTTFLPIQVGPATHQPGLRMLELSQLHLQLTLIGTGPIREDGENQLGAGDHPAGEVFLQVPLLTSAQLMIDNEQIRIRQAHQPTELLELAGANEGAGVRVIAAGGNRIHHIHLCRAGKLDALRQGGFIIDGICRLGGRGTEVDMQHDRFAAGFWTIEKQGCS
jgi:hypothetical protein